MGAVETAAGLADFAGRGAGTDAERRAAAWLAGELAAGGREARLETFWCRPNWAMTHAWHAALALAGGLVSVSSPGLGTALLALALLSVLADALTGHSLGRRLTPERASQNVVGQAQPTDPRGEARLRLLVTANYDAGRTGLVYRRVPRTLAARITRVTRGACPGWVGWLVIAQIWLLASAIVRLGGTHTTAIGVAQLPALIGLVLMLAALLELAAAQFGPAASDNASGVAVALALGRALDVAPARNLTVDLVLQGAGDGAGIGLRRHLRMRRRSLPSGDVAVLGLGPCGAGTVHWWVSDGSLLPLRYSRGLREQISRVADPQAEPSPRPHRGRGAMPALPARVAGLSAIALGCLDRTGLAPRSHLAGDTPELLDPAAMDAALGAALMLVDALDAELGRARGEGRGRLTPA
ncbi:MAG: hypothetical protein JO156_16950 [Solirubrobacterales bacterium]|nr:hypothetical protein [Solirubrobacterales bacterium]